MYAASANWSNAITTYKQLLTFVPGGTRVLNGLGAAYYYSGNYRDALATLTQLTEKTGATDTTFQLLAATQQAMDKMNAAKKTLQKGLARFPSSGLLYCSQGKVLLAEKKPAYAVRSWQQGIAVNDQYAADYKELALVLLNNNMQFPGLIYGETYLAMRHDTTGDDTFKKELYNGWNTLFQQLPDQPVRAADQKYAAIFKQLTPVMSDGASTENLTMVRIRFLMQLQTAVRSGTITAGDAGMAAVMPLVGYQEALVNAGLFDIYCQWLFGYAESPQQHAAWVKFHTGDMERFGQWHAAHYFVPGAILQPWPAYSETDQAFTKKKKR